MSRKTKCNIEFGFCDIAAAEDMQSMPYDCQPWDWNAQQKDIGRFDAERQKVYASFEQNFFILDGSADYLISPVPESDFVGYVSSGISNSECVLTSEPTIEFYFGSPHSSVGITLRFLEANGDYCNQVTIEWYDASWGLLKSQTFYPDSPLYFCDCPVQNYGMLIIYFESTSTPYRFVRLTEIGFGMNMVLEGTNLSSANLVEEVDVSSATVPINTLNVSIFSDDGKFSPLVDDNYYGYIQKRQQMEVFGTINGVKKSMGRYYVDTAVSDSEKAVNIKCVDLIGILDMSTFKGNIYSNAMASDIFLEIMASAGLTASEYGFDSVYESTLVSGWIPVCTHREALQQLAIATGAVIDTYRSGKVQMKERSNTGCNILKSSKVMTHSVTLGQAVTEAMVTGHRFSETGTANRVTLTEDVFDVGTHEIQFSDPAYFVSASGATITEIGVNYAVISVSTAGTVVLTGVKYADYTRLITYRPGSGDGREENVIEASAGMTLIGPLNAESVAESLYNYNQNYYTNTGGIILDGSESAGSLVDVEASDTKVIRGYITSMDTDLVNGMISNIKVIGTLTDIDD